MEPPKPAASRNVGLDERPPGDRDRGPAQAGEAAQRGGAATWPIATEAVDAAIMLTPDLATCPLAAVTRLAVG